MEYPIIFSTEMIKAILKRQKTQTRRVVSKNNSTIGESGDWDKLNLYGRVRWKDDMTILNEPYITETFRDRGFPNQDGKLDYQYLHVPYNFEEEGVIFRVYCQFHPGDRLWVKETYYPCRNADQELRGDCIYKTDDDAKLIIKGEWEPAIFMPRWANRITLGVTGIRTERVQDITEADAIAEGCPESKLISAQDGKPFNVVIPTFWFEDRWNKSYAKRGYGFESNPWVWVIDFKLLLKVR